MVLAISLQHFAGAENLDLGLLVLAYFGSYPNLALGFSHLFTLDYGTGLGPLPFYTAPRRYTTALSKLGTAPRRQPTTLLTLGALGLRAWKSGLALWWSWRSGLFLHTFVSLTNVCGEFYNGCAAQTILQPLPNPGACFPV